MIRSVEFDLQTKSEANLRLASKAGMFAKADRVKKQRAAVTAVLASSFGALVPTMHVQAGVAMVRNHVEAKLVRVAPGTLDDDNLRGALKAVRDAVARWIGVDDRDPLVTWSYAQEHAAQHVYRVRVVLTDRAPGQDRVVVLAETASEGRAAESRVKRQVKAAGARHGVTAYSPAASAGAGSSAARQRAETAFGKLTGKPTVDDLARAAERVLKKPGSDPQKAKGAIHRDPGEERPARDLAACTTCGAMVGQPCRDEPHLFGATIHGVHPARAKAAGINGVHTPPRAPTNGQRRIVPAAQAPLPLPPAYVRLPWEQCPCSDVEIDEPGPHIAGCPWNDPDFDGPAQMKIKRDPRHDGEHAPPTVRYAVPAEHRARFGSEVVLTRRRTTLAKIGDCWLYE